MVDDPLPTIGAPPPPPRRRAWLYVGLAAIVVLVIGGAWLVAGDENGSGCVSGLIDQLPDEATGLRGADLEVARAAGYDDSDTDAMIESAFELGDGPDPVTMQVRNRSFDDEDMPYAPSDVDCWVTDRNMVAIRGTFDEDAVESSDIADMEVDGDVLTTGFDPADAGDPSPGLTRAVDALVRDDAALFMLVPVGDDPATGPWTGVALAAGEPWDLVVVWAYPDVDSATDATDAVQAALTSDSIIPGLIDGDAADAVEREGSVVVLRAPLAGEPSDWRQPLVVLDAALGVDVAAG